MTAEIAIANKSAIALAADSAVSFGSSDVSKVYHTVNKINTLSKHHPIASMIYGGANFMDVPIETIVKMYREDKGSKPEETVFDYGQDFLEYISGRNFGPEDRQRENLLGVVHSEFMDLRNTIIKRIRGKIISDGRYSARDRSQIVSGVLDAGIKQLRNYEDLYETIISKQQLGRYYQDALNNMADEIFDGISLTNQDRKKLRSYAHLAINKQKFSNHHSGIIIAGFGSGEIFPSTVEIKVDGVMNGRLKYGVTSVRNIGRGRDDSEVSACIQPFAQREMVDRFMNGIDTSYRRYIEAYLSRVFAEFAGEIIDSLVDDEKLKESYLEAAADELDRTMDKFRKHLNQKQRNSFAQPILDIVDHLPKVELANMAEALVNLTSIKRRVSSEEETVGGPIDVAVMSRGDGFVWVKRKHYFDAELNPQFFETYMSKHRRGKANG